ncbi:hypothetical protein F4556_002386 [Kitasatospora gansuensis]|uniref:Uncharacterized protein n=1 Tax=Kitasatospora gansuensis TaxID=258050 RepID=A0A7W7SAD8_9ACTN|nr:hypothetical protein [Kitasatospora gansuensis]MBB4946851.1 hypothetical protein [Kitasatospora gansuensis]
MTGQELGVLTAEQTSALERVVVEHIATGLCSPRAEVVVAAQLLLIRLEQLGLPVGEAVDHHLARTTYRAS